MRRSTSSGSGAGETGDRCGRAAETFWELSAAAYRELHWPFVAKTSTAVWRGLRERPWTDLVPLGMETRPQKSECRFLPSFPGETCISVHDLAKGLSTYLDDARTLREWAFIIEAMPAEFEVDNHPAGEMVLDALWRASFGEPLREDQIAVIKALGEEELSQP